MDGQESSHGAVNLDKNKEGFKCNGSDTKLFCGTFFLFDTECVEGSVFVFAYIVAPIPFSLSVCFSILGMRELLGQHWMFCYVIPLEILY